MDPIRQLIEGFSAFTRRSYRAGNPYLRLIKQGQSPRIALVACSDSRVDPSLTLDCDPGDLFVIRNVGALVPPCEPDGAYHGTSAALEFAVCGLQVEHVVVMGHALCGGMRTLAQGDTESCDGFIRRWVSLAEPALERARGHVASDDFDKLERCCGQEAVKLSLGNLKTFSWIRERVEDGRLQLHGWYFDLPAGELLGYRSVEEAFAPLA